MALSMYEISVPVIVRGLGQLEHVLKKGLAHAIEKGTEPALLVEARLAPDMLTLAGQVQRASDTSKMAIERITGTPAPKMEDNEKTFAELYARIDNTIASLASISRATAVTPEAPPAIDAKIAVEPFTNGERRSS